jgi:hypothetical protein
MTKKILKADALHPKFIRLYSGNGTYGVAPVFNDQNGAMRTADDEPRSRSSENAGAYIAFLVSSL